MAYIVKRYPAADCDNHSDRLIGPFETAEQAQDFITDTPASDDFYFHAVELTDPLAYWDGEQEYEEDEDRELAAARLWGSREWTDHGKESAPAHCEVRRRGDETVLFRYHFPTWEQAWDRLLDVDRHPSGDYVGDVNLCDDAECDDFEQSISQPGKTIHRPKGAIG